MAGSTGVNTNVSIQSDPTDLSTILDNEALVDELMKRDLAERGNGLDSDEEGTGYDVKNDLSQAAADSAFDQMINDRLQLEDNVLDDEDNLHMCVGSPDDIEPCQLEGAPPGWFPPGPKEGWQYKQKTAKNEPHFSTVDNPGGWSPFTFRPHFAERYQTGTYMHHVTAGGAIPVPINEETGKRTSGNWEFFYNGWKQEDPNPNYVRTGANKDTIFPPDRKAKLDGELLKKMGLTRERMIEGDVLFFYQLILPFVDPAQSGIEGDPRKAYYTDVANYTNSYAYSVRGCSMDYGHRFKACSAEEIVNWDGIVTRNINGYIGNNWQTQHEHQHDPIISSTMSLTRWLDIKRNKKLCSFYEEKKRGEEGYDPTGKYRLIWDVQVHNVNCLI